MTPESPVLTPITSDAPHLEALETLFKALSERTRLRILALLAQGEEVCVCDIHASLGVPQPTASRHLAYLRRAGLVSARRNGVWMHYSLAPVPDPIVAAVVTAALHALTHTQVAQKDQRRLLINK